MGAGVLLVSCSDGTDAGRPSLEPLEVPDRRAVEELRIDGDAADLVQISEVAVAPDGTIVLTQPDDHLVRFFRSSGDPLGSVGREGEGPGEFRQPFYLGWAGDSLTVYDPGLGRFTVLDVRGGFGRTIQASSRPRAGPALPEFAGFALATPLRVLPDGGVVARVEVVRLPRPESGERRILFVRMDERGVVDRIIAEIHEERPGVRISSGNREWSAEFPFPNVPRYHLAADGSRLVVVEAALEGDRAGTYLVTAIRVQGDTVFSRRYPFDVMEISSEYADSVIEASAESMEERSPRWAAAYRRNAELPPMRPPVLSVLNGRDGTIWLRLRSPPRRTERTYLVLDADGTPLAEVALPARTTPRVADRDRLWATVPDEYGIPDVVRYRIDP